MPLPPKEGRGKGRPPHPLGDMIFACALKVYSEKSGRRNMTNLRNAAAAGLMEKYPSFTTVFRYMEDPALTPILHRMIEQSSLPLTAVETDFAAGLPAAFRPRCMTGGLTTSGARARSRRKPTPAT